MLKLFGALGVARTPPSPPGFLARVEGERVLPCFDLLTARQGITVLL
ncbi:MAG: hypothetical protein RL069_70, partial [Planctomycetota bacterium]